MKLTMLGTGNAMVTECYNTCFTLEEGRECFLVDGGGGNQLLKQLSLAGIDWKNITTIFVTHKHIDHVMGIVWMVRLICQSAKRKQFEGRVLLYAHKELILLIQNLSELLIQKGCLDYLYLGTADMKKEKSGLYLIPVEDAEQVNILGHPVTFFDIGSTKAKQFGFSMEYEKGKKLTCCGDEPYNQKEEVYARDSNWLLHEAFCLYREAESFKPYEKHHSTVKDAAELAQRLKIQNLLLYHTEDKNIKNRKVWYTQEGKQYYSGNLFVPEDLEAFEL